MYKRGELTSQEIAVLVLGIGGFVLVFLFLFAIFDNQSLTERELCRLSILERATLPSGVEKAVPLQCTTEKVCITIDEGIFGKESDCKQFAGEENVRVVKVKLNDIGQQTQAIRAVERETANAIFDCWAMTGQGKLDVFRGDGTTGQLAVSSLLKFAGTDIDQIVKTVQPKCIVCSRVALSEELIKRDTSNILSKVNVNNYMARELVPGSSLTYLQTLTDESVRSYAGADDIKNAENLTLVKSSTGGPQMAVIFMQIKTEADPHNVGVQAAALSGTAIGGGGLLTGVGRKAITTFPIVSTLVALGATGGAYLAAKDIAEDNQALSFAACSEAEKDGDKAKLGCSLVKPVVWDVSTVNQMCLGGIEGNL
ncbi:MAG: hypothetical protein ACP5NS_02220 [Candidatus Pacearchaeota archaeon]